LRSLNPENISLLIFHLSLQPGGGNTIADQETFQLECCLLPSSYFYASIRQAGLTMPHLVLCFCSNPCTHNQCLSHGGPHEIKNAETLIEACFPGRDAVLRRLSQFASPGERILL
jgi:hypothetical protein